jgi:hypothetical protein
MITRLTAAAFALAAALIAVPATSTAQAPSTPDMCINTNWGDFNACNVGNSGGGDAPYQAFLDERARLLGHWSSPDA